MLEGRHEPTPASRRVMILSVYLPTLLLSFGQGMLLPTLPLYARSFGVSWSLVGLAAAHGFQAPFLFNAAVSLRTLLLAAVFIVEIDQPTGTGRALDWQRLRLIGWTHRSDLGAAGAAQIFAQMIREGRRALLPL